MSRIITILLTGLLIPVQLYCNISGRTITSTFHPLPFVAIVHQSSGDWCMSGENGVFELIGNFAQGDTITISRYGYHPKKIVLDDSIIYEIVLQTKSIQLGDIRTTGKSSTENETIVSAQRSESNRLSSHSWMREIPGLSIRSYGSSASNLTISLNGGSAVHTKVMLEGVDLTNSLIGQTDISQLPLLLINDIAVNNAPGISTGSGAIDGSVNLKAKPSASSLSISQGSYGYRSIDLNLNHNMKNWTIGIGLGTFIEEGNFDSEWRDNAITRDNNAIQQKYIFARAETIIDQKIAFNSYFLQTWQNRELAGQIYSPTPGAKSDDDLQLFTANIIRLIPWGFVRGRVNHRYSSLYYSNPWTIPLESDHYTQNNQIQLDAQLHLQNNLGLYLLGEVSYDQINSTSINRRNRATSTAAISLNYQLLNWLSIIPAMRYDHSPKLYGESTYKLGIDVKPIDEITLSYSGGTAFRYPTFSDMYWSYVGNPDLKPEHSTRNSVVLKYVPNQIYYFAISFNNIDSRNLIKWQPGNPYWRPVNLAKVHRQSLAFQSKINLKHWNLNANYTYTQAKDLANDRLVRYSPNHTANAALYYLRERLKTGLQLRFTGKQIYIYDYPEDDYLDTFAILSFSIRYKLDLFGNNLNLDGLIDNLLNSDYMSVYGYPEPGINYRIALTYEFK